MAASYLPVCFAALSRIVWNWKNFFFVTKAVFNSCLSCFPAHFVTGDIVFYGMTTSQRYLESKPAGKWRPCSPVNGHLPVSFCVWHPSYGILCVHSDCIVFPKRAARFADMEWQTPAVSEKFQSRFGRRPGTADSGDTGLGTSVSDSTEGDRPSPQFVSAGSWMCDVTASWILVWPSPTLTR